MSYLVPPQIIAKRLSIQKSNATVTPTIITDLSQVTGIGTFVFQYHLIYRSTAAATGIRFDVNYTGTVTNFVWNQYWVDTSATASTAAPDQDEVLATGAVLGGFASRAKGTAGRGTTISVDTANVDMYMRIEGIMVVTVAGSLDLYHGSETAVSTTIEVGSSLLIFQTV